MTLSRQSVITSAQNFRYGDFGLSTEATPTRRAPAISRLARWPELSSHCFSISAKLRKPAPIFSAALDLRNLATRDGNTGNVDVTSLARANELPTAQTMPRLQAGLAALVDWYRLRKREKTASGKNVDEAAAR